MIRPLLAFLPVASVLIVSPLVAQEAVPPRPRVAGKMQLNLRERREDPPGSGKVKVVERAASWDVAKTAVILIDMWDGHYCQLAAQRVGVMGPVMNRVVSAARGHGVQVVHSPSGTVDMYADTPFRARVKQAPAVKVADDWFGKWCYLDPKREPPMPVDTSKSACDDPVVGSAVRRFNRQHASLDIIGFDVISDNAQEIHSYFQAEGIKHVVIMGVHTNMCVLGRPFGIRAMVRLGYDVVLARDLTDAMYDPRQPPYVSHTRGTELVIEHIERYWCPSIVSDDLTRVAPGSAGP